MEHSKWKFSVIIISMIYFWIAVYAGYYKDHMNVIYSDVVSYYSYLPALFVHKDLTMKFL